MTERRTGAGAAIIAAVAAALPSGAEAQTGATPPAAAHARPGHFAELEELQAARRAGTRAAYDLFLARHPASRYASDAKRERELLTR